MDGEGRAGEGTWQEGTRESGTWIPTNPSSGWLLESEGKNSAFLGEKSCRKHSRGATEPVDLGGEGGGEEISRRALPRTGQWRFSAGEIQTAHKCKKRWLASPETKEMSTEGTMQYYLSPIRLAKIKTKMVPSIGDSWIPSAGKWTLQSSWRECWEDSHPAGKCVCSGIYTLPFLGICFQETAKHMHKDTCSRICINQHCSW